MEYIDTLVLSVKKKELTEAELCGVTQHIKTVEHRRTRKATRIEAAEIDRPSLRPSLCCILDTPD